jgi:hypothetical protein
MTAFNAVDCAFMMRALSLAERGLFTTTPIRASAASW